MRLDSGKSCRRPLPPVASTFRPKVVSRGATWPFEVSETKKQSIHIKRHENAGEHWAEQTDARMVQCKFNMGNNTIFIGSLRRNGDNWELVRGGRHNDTVQLNLDGLDLQFDGLPIIDFDPEEAEGSTISVLPLEFDDGGLRAKRIVAHDTIGRHAAEIASVQRGSLPVTPRSLTKKSGCGRRRSCWAFIERCGGET
jgi:hypothetical protein